LVSHKHKNIVERTLSVELSKVSRWMSENKLSLNLGKPEAIQRYKDVSSDKKMYHILNKTVK